jgi:LmbE family N-acetylglucosaminyl deacetylase
VRVVTVFAGRVDSDAPAGEWDAKAGFTTEGEAAVARRGEDREACGLLGAEISHLPFGDRQYARDDDETVLEAVRTETERAPLVLLPGLPLAQRDHLRLHRLLLPPSLVPSPLALYLEQPYATLARSTPDPERWQRLPAAGDHRSAKLQALGCYASQVPLLGGVRVLAGVVAGEATAGGEAISVRPEATR